MKKIFALLLVMVCFIVPNCYAEEETVYYKDVYNALGEFVESVEITEEEYENADTSSLARSTLWETSYKKLTLTATSGYLTLTLTWKVLPSVQSYDVIAVRGENVQFSSDSLGTQLYTKSGSSGTVAYTQSGSNTQVFSNGIGVSMNLVDDATSYILTLCVSYTILNTGTPKIYGAYEHAITSVTLAQSQSYSLSSTGYGSVLLFTSSVKDKYDGMGGVSTQVSS